MKDKYILASIAIKLGVHNKFNNVYTEECFTKYVNRDNRDFHVMYNENKNKDKSFEITASKIVGTAKILYVRNNTLYASFKFFGDKLNKVKELLEKGYVPIFCGYGHCNHKNIFDDFNINYFSLIPAKNSGNEELIYFTYDLTNA